MCLAAGSRIRRHLADHADAGLAVAFKGANVLLGHKLIALCDNTAIDPLKPNRMPNWKAAASALRRSKPKTSFIAAARPVTRVALCETRIDDGGKPVSFRYEITKNVTGRDVTMFQQHVGNVDGQEMKLPQDLRMVPPAGKPVVRTCRDIGPKGELTDA